MEELFDENEDSIDEMELDETFSKDTRGKSGDMTEADLQTPIVVNDRDDHDDGLQKDVLLKDEGVGTLGGWIHNSLPHAPVQHIKGETVFNYFRIYFKLSCFIGAVKNNTFHILHFYSSLLLLNICLSKH